MSLIHAGGWPSISLLPWHMGLSCALEMEAFGSLKNGTPDEEGAPESWEIADLEESMKNLMAQAKVSSGSHVDGREAVESLESDLSLLSSTTSGATNTVDVDGFLREALQNPRDRLTILRLEQEVERFMRNPKLQQLEFQPMPSSYLRLAAHRVAQHYSLQSMVVDTGSLEGSRIVARKSTESRYPTIRLADIPVDMPAEEKPLTFPMPKVAIKQRPTKGGRANGDGIVGAGANRLVSSKSVEERKEEYNKARARIFSNELAAKVGELEGVSVDDARLIDCYSAEDVPKVEDKYKSLEETRERSSPVRVVSDFSLNDGRNREYLEKESFKAKVIASGNNSRVAIFRDREKDRKDPDYDRSYDRYSQRFEPGFGMNVGGPFGMQAMYTPLVNYNTEFPQLAGPRPQMHMEPPPPPPIPQQRMQRHPWDAPGAGNMSFRPPDVPMAPFTPGHIGPPSAMAMYMHAPQYGYPGPSVAYMHPHDRYQQSLTQQSHPQQPDSSFNHARRR